jgi:beta-N-acetylhexosaminidase
MTRKIGEFFMLGFRDASVPAWMKDFAREFGLGGAILFDYDCIRQKYERNIYGPAQTKDLCAEIHALASRPLIFIDQEGGRVRRLKEELGFAPLPSAEQFARLPPERQTDVARRSYRELRDLGIDVNLSPVVDVNANPESPDVGSAQRSYSTDPGVVESCAIRLIEIARSVGLKLCLKHFPGTGGASVNPHDHVMDLSDCLSEAQLGVFRNLLPADPMILFSHGIVRQWQKNTPVCLSSVAVDMVRGWSSDAYIVSDDLQMQGVQKLMSTNDACARALRAGLDLVIIGNNLMDEQNDAARFAENLILACERDPLMAAHAESAISRTQRLKLV